MRGSLAAEESKMIADCSIVSATTCATVMLSVCGEIMMIQQRFRLDGTALLYVIAINSAGWIKNSRDIGG